MKARGLDSPADSARRVGRAALFMRASKHNVDKAGKIYSGLDATNKGGRLFDNGIGIRCSASCTENEGLVRAGQSAS